MWLPCSSWCSGWLGFGLSCRFGGAGLGRLGLRFWGRDGSDAHRLLRGLLVEVEEEVALAVEHHDADQQAAGRLSAAGGVDWPGS